MTWFILAACSALLDAGRNLLSRIASQREPASVVNSMMFGLTTPLYLLLAALLPRASEYPALYWLFVSIHVAIECAASLILAQALKLAPVSTVAPVLGSSGALLLIADAIGDSARPSPIGGAGVLLVATGTYFSGSRSKGTMGGPTSRLKGWSKKGKSLAFLVSALWAMDAMTLRAIIHMGDWPLALAVTSPIVWSVSRLLTGPSTLDHSKRQRVPQFLWGALAACSFGSLALMILALGYPLAPASHVVAVKRSSIVISMFLGRVLLGEPVSVTMMLGGTLVFIGAAAIAIGT